MSSKPVLSLINVVMEGDYQFEQEIPLGIGAIAAFLRQRGFPVSIQQCLPAKGETELEMAARVEADVYGFQLNMVNFLHVRTIASRI